MSSLEDRIGIANPQQPHCATILLLDTSGSMSGAKIQELNEGLKAFKAQVSGDDLASKRVDLLVVTFGERVSVRGGFSSIEEFTPPELIAEGSTPMGEAILRSLDLIAQRKQQYRDTGVDYFRPWVFMITDGEPTDMQVGDAMWSQVVTKVHEGEAKKQFLFFAVAVEPANLSLLTKIAPPERPPIRLIEKRFKELFDWLSKSQAAVSASSVGDTVKLESPVAAGWGEIGV
jgi:uncharacterized protein YegL